MKDIKTFKDYLYETKVDIKELEGMLLTEDVLSKDEDERLDMIAESIAVKYDTPEKLNDLMGDITNEGILGSVLGGLTGFALGKTIGKIIARVLGIEKGILYDLLTSRLVGAALGSAIGKKI